MKNLKNILVVVALVTFSIVYTRFVPADSIGAYLVVVIIGCLFAVHFIIRKIPAFKGYFLSPVNFLSAKYSSVTQYDIPIELMFEKTIEVLESTHFKVQQTDKSQYEIFATSPISWRSWGENLYISFEEQGGKTLMTFHSVAVMQMHTWDKNRKNSEHLINTIEESLII